MAGLNDKWTQAFEKMVAKGVKYGPLLSSAVVKRDDGTNLTVAFPKGSRLSIDTFSGGSKDREELDAVVAEVFGPRDLCLIVSGDVKYVPYKPEKQDLETTDEADPSPVTDGTTDTLYGPEVSTSDPPYKGANGRFDHSELGDVLMQDFNACIADDIPVIWDPEHRRYRSGHEAIERVMIAQRRNITRAQRNETLSYIMLQSERRDMADPRLIAFTNGILNLETLDLAEPSPEHVIPNVIPHRWNPDAACTELEEAIAAWACDDAGRVANIVETIGLCMYRGRDVTACPVLVGRGSNGKSTLLNLLRKVIGEENVSSLDLQTIGRRFQSVALIGKLANIADDIPNAFVEGEGMATLKRAITGDTIPAEIKGGATFSFRPYCRFVFSANEIPRFGDTSHGTYRRFVPVRFNARFSTADGTANTHLERTLDTEQAYERAIVLGIDALKGCIGRGHMTVTDDQREIIEDMRLQNSSVVTFVEESTRGREWFVGRTTSNAYEHYTAFCEKTGMKVLNRNNFTLEVKTAYDLTTKRTRWEGGQSSTFIERA